MCHKMKAVLLMLVLTVSAGCSSTPTGLDRASLAANKITTVDLTSPEKITYTRSKGGSRATGMLGGGLIGSLVGMGVDGAVNMSRANTAMSVINALGSYDANEVFRGKLATLSGPSFSSALKINAHTVPVESDINVLNVATHYALSSNHQAVVVSALTKIKPSAKSSVYTKRFSVNAPINMGLKEGERINATDRLIKNPAILKQAIERAMDSIVQQIAVDLNTGTSAL